MEPLKKNKFAKFTYVRTFRTNMSAVLDANKIVKVSLLRKIIRYKSRNSK